MSERCTAIAGCRLDAGHGGFHLIPDEAAELRDRVVDLESENARLTDWKQNIINTVKAFPEYEPGEWAGDKEGWGYCFELINYVRRERDRLEQQLSTMTTARDEACDIAATAITLKGDFIGHSNKLGSERVTELKKIGHD